MVNADHKHDFPILDYEGIVRMSLVVASATG